jgi:ABC-type lipoprotein export system ATPase subunit
VTHEWNFTQLELTLVVLGIELMIMQSLKHNVEMPFMLFLVLRIDQDVINEDHAKLVQLYHEYIVNKVHEVSGGVGQPK